MVEVSNKEAQYRLCTWCLVGIVIMLIAAALTSCGSTKEFNYQYIDSVYVHQKDCVRIRPILIHDTLTGETKYVGNDTLIVRNYYNTSRTSRDTTIVNNKREIHPAKEVKTVENVGFFYKFGLGVFGAVCGVVILLMIKYLRNPIKALVSKIIHNFR